MMHDFVNDEARLKLRMKFRLHWVQIRKPLYPFVFICLVEYGHNDCFATQRGMQGFLQQPRVRGTPIQGVIGVDALIVPQISGTMSDFDVDRQE